MEYNISEAELPTMVVRYENKLILRSVITGQHLEDMGYAPVWDDVPITPALQARCQRIEMAHNEALEALVRLYPCEEIVPPQILQVQTMPQCQPKLATPKKPLPVVPARAPSPLAINEAELPPCKVHRNYCCNYCNFCTQNPRSHLMHQRQVHGIRLSIHCCHHCQYASRYFQKLKRHVKMVHMGNSPGKSKMRSKTAARRAPKPKVLQATNIAQPPTKHAELPINLLAKPTESQEPTKLTTEVLQKQNLLVQHTAGSSDMPPAVFKNPEAFFEAAYRNQLVQQQLQEQRFKEYVKLSNQLNHVTQLETAKAPALEISTPATRPAMNLTQNSQVTESLKEIKPPTTACSPKLPAQASQVQSQVKTATTEMERKRIYGCRKCSYVTHIKSRYNKHVKYHSMPMIQCDKCEFRTTYKWNLTRHLRSHHGNGLYKCSVCSFSAHMKQSLTSHELNHHSPPVGHVSRVHNKPFRRRRCRVGGSDLMHDMRAIMNGGRFCNDQANILVRPKTAPVTADNATNFSSTVGHESLKLVIKREAGTSSYSSTQTPMSTATVANSANELGTLFGNDKKFSSPSASFSSSYSASPSSSTSSNLSVIDPGIPASNGLESTSITLTSTAKAETLQDQYRDAFDSPLAENPSEVGLTTGQPQSFSTGTLSHQPAPEIPNISTSQTTALYSSSEDSDPDSEDDSDDTYSTVSANEIVPHGLHIAYDSSSPDRKSSLSDSETSSECSLRLQHSPEVSPHKSFPDHAASVSTLEN